jgi:hypothetical protein
MVSTFKLSFDVNIWANLNLVTVLTTFPKFKDFLKSSGHPRTGNEVR